MILPILFVLAWQWLKAYENSISFACKFDRLMDIKKIRHTIWKMMAAKIWRLDDLRMSSRMLNWRSTLAELGGMCCFLMKASTDAFLYRKVNLVLLLYSKRLYICESSVYFVTETKFLFLHYCLTLASSPW